MIAARFRHYESRDGQSLLHDHLVLSVKVRRTDGQWGTCRFASCVLFLQAMPLVRPKRHRSETNGVPSHPSWRILAGSQPCWRILTSSRSERHRTGCVRPALQGLGVRELVAEPDGAARTCSSFGLPVSKATVTHHSRALREAGLIRQVDRGNSRMASLRRADIEQRFPGLLGIVAAEPEE